MNKKKLIRLAQDNAHIPTDEIKRDILDTNREIQEESEKVGLYHGRFDTSRRKSIQERREFVKSLENILKGRKLLSDNA